MNPPAMIPSRWVTGLGLLVVVLATIAAAIGLLANDGSGPYPFTTVHGEIAQIYGQGLYRHDSLFTGAGNRGVDAVTVTLGVPLLILALALYRRGSARGALLLVGCLAYFLYVYASMAFAVAWNELFLVYVAVLAASFFALVRLMGGHELLQAAPTLFAAAPRRGPAAFLVIAGLATMLVWLMPVVDALASGQPPRLLDHTTTMFTYALDLSVVAPATCLAGILIWYRNPVGYLIAIPPLGIVALLAPVIAASTASQLRAGIAFTPAEMAGPVAGFVLLGGLAVWVLASILRAAPGAQSPGHSESTPLQGEWA